MLFVAENLEGKQRFIQKIKKKCPKITFNRLRIRSDTLTFQIFLQRHREEEDIGLFVTLVAKVYKNAFLFSPGAFNCHPILSKRFNNNCNLQMGWCIIISDVIGTLYP